MVTGDFSIPHFSFWSLNDFQGSGQRSLIRNAVYEAQLASPGLRPKGFQFFDQTPIEIYLIHVGDCIEQPRDEWSCGSSFTVANQAQTLSFTLVPIHVHDNTSSTVTYQSMPIFACDRRGNGVAIATFSASNAQDSFNV